MWALSVWHREAQRVCSSKALLWHNAGGSTALQKRGQLRACLFMAVEYLVAKGRLREVSLVSACWNSVCSFMGIRCSHRTLLYTVGCHIPTLKSLHFKAERNGHPQVM